MAARIRHSSPDSNLRAGGNPSGINQEFNNANQNNTGEKPPYITHTLHTSQKVSFHAPYITEVSGSGEDRKETVISDTMGPKHLRKKYAGMKVEAPLPETFNFSVGNEVNQTFDIMKFKKFFIGGAASLANKNFDRGYTERLYWRSIAIQDFTIEMSFDAYYSGKVDVILPTKKLILMATPVANQTKLGETLTGYWDGPPRVNIAYGNVIWFESCWIKSVNINYSNKLDNNFDPLSATATVNFVTQNPMSFQDIEKQMSYFAAGNSNQ